MIRVQSVIQRALQQHGLFARFQLEQLGIPEGSHTKILKNSLFEQKAFGVYAISGTQESWHHRATIAVFSCGKHALLSHESALINLGLLSPTDRRSRRGSRAGIHVTSRRKVQVQQNAIYHRSLYVDDGYPSIVHNGIPQVSVEHAIIDSAVRLTRSQLTSVVDNAFLENLTTPARLSQALQEMHACPGREKHRVRKLVHEYLRSPEQAAKIESVLEMRVLRVLRQKLKLNPVPQYEVRISSRRYRIDLAIVEHKIAIEVDGFRYHRNRDTFDNDRQRRNDLVGKGWKVVQITAAFSDQNIVDAVLNVLPQRES